MRTKILLLILLIMVLIVGCSKTEKENVQKAKPKAPLVKVEKVGYSPISRTVKLIGTVEAKVMTTVVAPVEGYIERLNVNENQYVKKEKVLAVIASQERTSLVSQARNKVEEIKSKMGETSPNSTEYTQLNSQLQQAEKELEYADKLFLGIPVTSPMNGVVTQKFIELGSAVVAKQNLFTIVDFNSLIIKSSVSEELFSKINHGDRLRTKFNAFPEKEFYTVVTLKYRQIDPVTRNFPVEMKLVNGTREIMPGMMAELELVTDKRDRALTVQNDVFIVNQKGEKVVYVVKDGVAHQRIVTTGLSNERVTEVISGLSEGEEIVVMGQELLKDGIGVTIQKTKEVKGDKDNTSEPKKEDNKKR
jgi:membrane fusion protein (multidrug efflux system)